MLLRTFLLFLLLTTSLCEAKPPQLTPKDTKNKIEEILKAHAIYHKFKPDLARKALSSYIEYLDPGKLYFLKSDIEKWLNADEELITRIIKEYKTESFTVFEEIHEVMICAIARRNALESKIDSNSLLTGVQPTEFKDLDWATNEDLLLDRLVRLKSLQMEAAEKLGQETKQQFIQRLNKKRYTREEELVTHSPTEKKQVIFSCILKAVSSSLDSQTAYFTPNEASRFMIQVQQKLYGIGAQLRDDLNGISIVRILDGGPASIGQKLKIGDKIIAVNKEPIVGMDVDEAASLIRGPQGSKVELTLLRPKSEENLTDSEELINVDIVRGEVILKETRYDSRIEPYGDGVIGYFHLYSFYQDTKTSSATDLAKALEEIKCDHNLKGVILDLRNNGGGLLPQAVAVSGLFIKKGVVVSVKDNTKEIQRLRNIDTKVTWDGPLIILTNRASASAAEIVAQALQDYGRAIIVGEQTYGKGTFQTFTLEASNFGKVNPKGEYKVTRGRYYTVSGKSPQLVGVQPDISVPGELSQLEIGEKYSKYPLPSDQIPPSFDDDLSDIPPIHRPQIARLYKFDLQSVSTKYTSFLPKLQKNSSVRIQQNKNYQNFLAQLEKNEFLSESIEVFGQEDLQLSETMNIMKDFILLHDAEKVSYKPSKPSDKEAA